MIAIEREAPRAGLAARIAETHGLDTVDICRMRLLALRARIEGNWPHVTGRFIHHGGLRPELATVITDLLVALPTPLPIFAGAEPEPLFHDGETNLCVVAGRAVDAGLALLEGHSMDDLYNGHVKLLESYRPDAAESIVVPYPSVGLLASTIIGTLEAVAELISEPDPMAPKKETKGKSKGKGKVPSVPAAVRRGQSAPRI